MSNPRDIWHKVPGTRVSEEINTYLRRLIMRQDKKEFVQEFGELLRKYCPEYSIDNLRYCNPGEIFDEEVVVTFTNGYEHAICVNHDSIPAMIRDILRGIVL